jgi:hypothetical protein
MNESIISADHFHNEQAAYDFIESKIWPNGPVCPHSESRERMNKMNGKRPGSEPTNAMRAQSHLP